MNTLPAYIVLLAAVIGGVYGFNYLNEVDIQKAAVLSATEHVKSVKDMVSAKERTAETGHKILAHVSQLTQEKKELSEKLESAKAVLRDLESTHGYLTTSVPDMVEKIRKAALGKSVGDVTLADGKVLRDAKPTQITDGHVSFLHFAGSTRVEGRHLPTDLKDRFRIGKPPILGDSSTILSGAPTSSSESLSQAPNSGEASSSISSMREKIAVLAVQITQAKQNIESWMDQAEKHDELANEARTAGRPTYTHTDNAKKARASAAKLQEQVTQAEVLKTQLEVRLQQTEKEARS